MPQQACTMRTEGCFPFNCRHESASEHQNGAIVCATSRRNKPCADLATQMRQMSSSYYFREKHLYNSCTGQKGEISGDPGRGLAKGVQTGTNGLIHSLFARWSSAMRLYTTGETGRHACDLLSNDKQADALCRRLRPQEFRLPRRYAPVVPCMDRRPQAGSSERSFATSPSAAKSSISIVGRKKNHERRRRSGSTV